MEIITHLVGVCNDTHTHIDIIDILIAGSLSISFFMTYLKSKIKFFIKFLNSRNESRK